MGFIIHHFADMVEYDTNGFVEKNRDTINDEHLSLLKASEVSLVSPTGWNTTRDDQFRGCLRVFILFEDDFLAEFWDFSRICLH